MDESAQRPQRGERHSRSLTDRPTTDLLLLMIATTICLAVLIGLCSVVVIAVLNPDADTRAASSAIADVINTLIGLLAGFLAGRTNRNVGSSDQ